MYRWSKLSLCLLLGLIFPGFARDAVLFEGKNAAEQYRLAALTLAGIVNRDSAQIFLANVREAWSFSGTDENWEIAYRDRGGVTFQHITSFSTLFNLYKDRIKGAITYEPRRWGNFSGQSFLWQGEYAALIGGLTDCLPLPEATARALGLPIVDSVLVEDMFDGDLPIKVPARIDQKKHPWNNTSWNEEQRYLALVDWGIVNLLPRCNPQRCYIREINDFTILHRMFQLNLAGSPPGGVNFYALPTARADLIERLFLFMQNKNPHSLFHVYGWMDPEPLVQWIATFGGTFHETIQNNISWHATFPVEKRKLRPPAQTTPEQVTLEDKYYLVFIASEGDASNWALSFQGGAWLSPKRGSVPVNWGWNLHLLDTCPFIAQYYYDTATKNDGFVSVMSPLGYVYPDLWDEEVWPDAVGQTRSLMDHFGIHDFYAYKHYASNGHIFFRGVDIYNSFDFPRMGRFLSDVNAELTILFDPQLASQYPTSRYGALMFNHEGDGSFYGASSDLNAMSTRILNSLKGKGKPYFMVAGYQRFFPDDYGNWPSGTADISIDRLGQVVQKLKADPLLGKDVEVVTIEKFSALMRKKLNWSPVQQIPVKMPDQLVLHQNHPNPFNGETTLSFDLDQTQMIRLTIYNTVGAEMMVVREGIMTSGHHRIPLQAVNWPTGVYYCQLQGRNLNLINKMILIR